MILCLDVGNSQIYGGLFQKDQLKLQFRMKSKSGASSDEMGLFLRSVLKENGFESQKVSKIAICSVVPEQIHSLKNCCIKYFKINPFILQAGVKTGLKIKYHNPLEVGADRIANAISATHLYPKTGLIIIDFGTATTFCAITKDREYLGGTIIPGIKISMESLVERTAKLPSVEIVNTDKVIGRSTVQSIQSGLYYGTLGSVKEIISQIRKNCFDISEPPLVIGTGGFAKLFSKEKLFDFESPELVLMGLFVALKNNI